MVARDYWLHSPHLDYHVRQFDEPYRSTVALAEFIREVTERENVTVANGLDVGCGAGANLYYLSRVFPDVAWTGVDIAKTALEIGRRRIAADGVARKIELLETDFNDLPSVFAVRSFDLVLSIQTLSWLPSYEEALQGLIEMVEPGGLLMVTSLFTDFLLDVTSRVRTFPDADFAGPADDVYYNVYCFERFVDVASSFGASVVMTRDFEIDVDLDPPESRLLGTYTERLADGRRVQRSGPLAMPWRFVALRVRSDSPDVQLA